MFKTLPQRFQQIKAKLRNRHHSQQGQTAIAMELIGELTDYPDADFMLRQQCTWPGKPEPVLPKAFVNGEYLEGEETSFAYNPEMCIETKAHRVLTIPPSVVNSDNICTLYHELCRRIYTDEKANKSTSPGGTANDICIWIKPYAEIRIERNIHGIEQRKIVKGAAGGTRLRGRMLLVKWMLDNSDWQEQLATRFWNLPKQGVGRDVTLPWFMLEVEYKTNGRKKLFEAHKHEFGARDITLEMFLHPASIVTGQQEVLVKDKDMVVETGRVVIAELDGGVTVETGRIVIEDCEVLAEAGRIVIAGGETIVEFGGVTKRPGDCVREPLGHVCGERANRDFRGDYETLKGGVGLIV